MAGPRLDGRQDGLEAGRVVLGNHPADGFPCGLGGVDIHGGGYGEAAFVKELLAVGAGLAESRGIEDLSDDEVAEIGGGTGRLTAHLHVLDLELLLQGDGLLFGRLVLADEVDVGHEA